MHCLFLELLRPIQTWGAGGYSDSPRVLTLSGAQHLVNPSDQLSFHSQKFQKYVGASAMLVIPVILELTPVGCGNWKMTVP